MQLKVKQKYKPIIIKYYNFEINPRKIECGGKGENENVNESLLQDITLQKI